MLCVGPKREKVTTCRPLSQSALLWSIARMRLRSICHRIRFKCAFVFGVAGLSSAYIVWCMLYVFPLEGGAIFVCSSRLAAAEDAFIVVF